MKIIKQNKPIVEAETGTEKKVEVAAPIAAGSTTEIAADIAAKAKEASGVELTSAEATAAAEDIKAGQDLLNTDEAHVDVEATNPENTEAENKRASLGSVNSLTKVLDMAFNKAERDLEDQEGRKFPKANANVLVTGLPGSGKTASIYDWADSHNPKINIVYVNAKNNDLQAFIDGFTVRDINDPYKATSAFSDNLSDLEKPNSVLFLDEFNRQVKSQIRAALLTLIQEHAVAGKGDRRQHFFKNLLFTIAAINPSVPSDKGAAPLNQAEQTRFLFKPEYDSNVEATLDFFTKHYKDILANLKPEDPKFLSKAERALRRLDLGTFIVSHKEFKYGSRDDLDDAEDQHKIILNQRTLTDKLDASQGDPKEFEFYIDNDSTGLNMKSDLLEKDIDMLLHILKDYTKPSLQDLAYAYGFDLTGGGQVKAKQKPEQAVPEKEAEADTESEDDAELFAKPAPAAGATVPSAAAAASILKKAVNAW